jgi:hypothetical protein
MVCVFSAVLNSGALGWSGFGLVLAFSDSTKANNPTVLAAAPFKTTCIGVDMWALTSLYAPPEYSKVTFLKTQSLQSNPSSGWVKFSITTDDIVPCSGGIVGSPAKAIIFWADAD